MRLAVLCAIVAVCTGCIYDGSYRYPCQDPDNWEMEECRPPVPYPEDESMYVWNEQTQSWEKVNA